MLKNSFSAICLFFIAFSIQIFAQNTKKSTDNTEHTKLRIRNYDIKTQAHFPAGDMALYTFIAKNLKYSDVDKEKQVHGNILIRFDVDADSTVKEVRLIRDLCVDCGKSLHLLFETLKFAPAITNGGQQIRSNVMMEVPVWAH